MEGFEGMSLGMAYLVLEVGRGSEKGRLRSGEWQVVERDRGIG